MKKSLMLLSALTLCCYSLSASAITIVNHNKKKVQYRIAFRASCAPDYLSGKLAKEESVTWTSTGGSVSYAPKHVCVHARGSSSVLGEFAKKVNNKGCTITIENAGFAQGIKIVKGPGC